MADSDVLAFYEANIFRNGVANWDKRSGKRNFVVRDADGNIIGALTLITRDGRDHIWLCGIRADDRGAGHFRALIAQMIAAGTTPEVSVATIPVKWANMAGWIAKKGGRQIATEDTAEGDKITYLLDSSAL